MSRGLLPRGYPATPGDLLTPQPAPVRTDRSQSVTDWILSDPSVFPPEMAELFRLRREQGVAVYGTELLTHNGRSALVDALQESLDTTVYLAQALAECDDGSALVHEIGEVLMASAHLTGRLAGMLGVRPCP